MVMQQWDPYGHMSSMRRMMDRLFDDSLVPMPAWSGGAMGGFDLDVLEQGDDFVVKASLPGMKPEDVKVTVERGVLTIQGETRDESERGEGRYHHRERRWGRVARQVILPDDVDGSACDASFENGVLTITLPRAEHARTTRIPIRGQGQHAGQAVIEGEKAGPSSAPGQKTDSGPAQSTGTPPETGKMAHNGHATESKSGTTPTR
jgi:HSP20 family protein